MKSRRDATRPIVLRHSTAKAATIETHRWQETQEAPMRRIACPMIFVGLAIAASARGQESLTEHTLTLGEKGKPGQATIDSMAWLAGHWSGDAMGGQVDEIWSPPREGEMIGMFRAVRQGKPSLYELMTMTETGGGLSVRLKHFDPDFKGWEPQEKFVTFAFVTQKDNHWYFDGLTFAHPDSDRLIIYVAGERDGKFSEMKFELRRQ
jgi:hypothetical protein